MAATQLPIHDRARLILVGDWGTGVPRARKVASQIRKVLELGQAEGREQHVIHLGDVYYSGWKREYQKRFLAHWPVDATERDAITSWSLNGNHDMYSGGHDYYDFLLRDPRFAAQEQSSFFSLSNGCWEILGLDTAWDDHALKDPQADWIQSRLAASGRNVLLLSHHQLFSVYEGVSEKLEEKLKGVLDSNRIRAWFWGHEHRCMLFRPYKKVPAARCVGHGGVPVYMWHREDEPYPEPGLYEYRAYIPKGLEHWAYFGFAVLDFDGPVIHVRYINEDGFPHKYEEIA